MKIFIFLIESKFFLQNLLILGVTNYRLVSLASSTNMTISTFFGPYFSGTAFLAEQFYYAGYDPIVGSALPYLDKAGTVFNFQSRLIIFCGGIQVII